MLSSTVQSEALAPYHLYRMEDADIVGEAGIQGQGPFVRYYVRICGGRVEAAAFETYTCPNAIACGSWTTRWMEGREPDVLARLTPGDLTMVLGGLPLGKEHCAQLAVTALKDMLAKWASSGDFS